MVTHVESPQSSLYFNDSLWSASSSLFCGLVCVCVVPIDTGGGVLEIHIVILRLLLEFLGYEVLFQAIEIGRATT